MASPLHEAFTDHASVAIAMLSVRTTSYSSTVNYSPSRRAATAPVFSPIIHGPTRLASSSNGTDDDDNVLLQDFASLQESLRGVRRTPADNDEDELGSEVEDKFVTSTAFPFLGSPLSSRRAGARSNRAGTSAAAAAQLRQSRSSVGNRLPSGAASAPHSPRRADVGYPAAELSAWSVDDTESFADIESLADADRVVVAAPHDDAPTTEPTVVPVRAAAAAGAAASRGSPGKGRGRGAASSATSIRGGQGGVRGGARGARGGLRGGGVRSGRGGARGQSPASVASTIAPGAPQEADGEVVGPKHTARFVSYAAWPVDAPRFVSYLGA